MPLVVEICQRLRSAGVKGSFARGPAWLSSSYIEKMSKLLPGIRLYVGATSAYGLAHGVPYAWNKKTRMYGDSSKCDMLLVDKCFLVAANTVTAPMLWPLIMRDDLIRLECLVRGKSTRDYLPNANDDAA